MDYISHCCIEELRSSKKSIIFARSQPWYEILWQTCKEDVKSASREVVDRFKALYPDLTVVKLWINCFKLNDIFINFIQSILGDGCRLLLPRTCMFITFYVHNNSQNWAPIWYNTDFDPLQKNRSSSVICDNELIIKVSLEREHPSQFYDVSISKKYSVDFF